MLFIWQRHIDRTLGTFFSSFIFNKEFKADYGCLFRIVIKETRDVYRLGSVRFRSCPATTITRARDVAAVWYLTRTGCQHILVSLRGEHSKGCFYAATPSWRYAPCFYCSSVLLSLSFFLSLWSFIAFLSLLVYDTLISLCFYFISDLCCVWSPIFALVFVFGCMFFHTYFPF